MIIKLYEYDEFPIIYDTKTKEKTCIEMCMQCPLYIDNHYLIENKIAICEDLIKEKIIHGDYICAISKK